MWDCFFKSVSFYRPIDITKKLMRHIFKDRSDMSCINRPRMFGKVPCELRKRVSSLSMKLYRYQKASPLRYFEETPQNSLDKDQGSESVFEDLMSLQKAESAAPYLSQSKIHDFQGTLFGVTYKSHVNNASQLTPLSPADLSQIKRLLQESALTVRSCSLQLRRCEARLSQLVGRHSGFSRARVFELFKDETGMTPSHYRRGK